MNQSNITDAIVKRSKEADFSKVFEQTIDNYKKIVLPASIAILLMMFVFLSIMIGITVIFMITTHVDFTDIVSIQQAIASVPPYVNAIFAITWAILLTPLTAGFMVMAHEAEKGRHISFGMVFSYFNKPGLKHLLLSAVLVTLFTEIVGEGAMFVTNDPESMAPHPAIALLLMVFNLSVVALTILIIPLIVFENLTAIQAIKASISITRKSFFTIFLLLILIGICTFLGFFAFCLGIIATIPLLFSFRYVLYRNMVGIDNVTEVETIGTPQTDY